MIIVFPLNEMLAYFVDNHDKVIYNRIVKRLNISKVSISLVINQTVLQQVISKGPDGWSGGTTSVIPL